MVNPTTYFVDICTLLTHWIDIDRFKNYKKEYKKSAIPLTFKQYFSVTIGVSVIIYLLVVLLLPIADILTRVVAGFITAMLSFLFFYIYPIEHSQERSARINAELPLALNYFAAILGSGAPPNTAFRMIAQFEEYEELSKEAKKIVRYTELMGYDLPRALTKTAASCPSSELSEILVSLKSELISGGNITKFFEEKATDKMNEYARKQEKYEKDSDVLATIYLVIALVAPLLFITVIAIMDFISSSGVGDLLGAMSLPSHITVAIFNLGVFIGIPLINVLFIIIVKMTQPEMI